MKEIVDILMRRDGMTEESARALCNITTEEILACGGDYDVAIQIIEDNLGLEPDYLVQLI